MSNTHSSFLQGVTATFLALGILMCALGSSEALFAREAQQGTTVLDAPAAVESSAVIRSVGNEVHPAAMGADDVESRLLLGALLIVAGFGFHALLVLRARHRSERARYRKMPFLKWFVNMLDKPMI